MLFQYHPDSDMLYIKLVDGTSAESEEIVSGIVLDFDENGRVIGIEIEDASKLVDLSRVEVTAFPLTDLIVSKRSPTKVA